MEWVYLILILVFMAWSAQMVISYKRQAEKIEAQIAAAQTGQEEVTRQALRYEVEAEQRKARLEELEARASELANKEKDLQKNIVALKQQEATRRPTRFKVDSPDQTSGEA